MIMAQDTRRYPGDIRQPSLVLCGDHNFCTPLPLSEEIARTVPGAERVVFEDSGELIGLEKEEDFLRIFSAFTARH
jgi:aminoacrylate hydrolase